MEIAVRPHIAAGVALLGAGVIAVSPMAPPVPDIHLPSISTAANNLVALTSPLNLGDSYNQVLQAAIANIQGLVKTVVDDPAPVLGQLAANQAASLSTLASALQTAGSAAATTLTTQVPALLQTAVSQLGANDISGAVNTLLQIPLSIAAPALGLLPAVQQIITQPITNLVKVIQAVTDPINAPLALVGFIAPLISMTGATGVAIQNVVDALGTGEVQNVANAVLTAPATIADGLLNGGYGPDLGPLVGQQLPVFAGGLLSMSELVMGGPSGFFVKTAGPLGAVLFLRSIIASALAPAKPAAPAPTALVAKTDPAALPAASAPTIALPAGEAPTETKPAESTPATGTTPGADPTAPAAGTAPATAPADDTAPAKADDATAPAATDPTAAKGDEGTGTTTTPAKSDDTTSTTPVKTTKPTDTDTTSTADKGDTTGTTPAGSTDTKSGNEAKPSTKAGDDAGKSGGDGSAAGKSSDTAGASTKGAAGADKPAGAKHSEKHGAGK